MARATKYNKLTSPELLARVNPENLQLMEEFLAYLRSMRHSKGPSTDIGTTSASCLSM